MVACTHRGKKSIIDNWSEGHIAKTKVYMLSCVLKVRIIVNIKVRINQMFDLLDLNVLTALLCDCFSSCWRETMAKSIVWGEKDVVKLNFTDISSTQ